MIKNLGDIQRQAAPAITFCIPKNSSSTDDTGAKWTHTLHRKEGTYVVSSGVANGLAYLRVQDGDTFALHRLQHFTSAAKKPSVSMVVDICATSLPDATTYTKRTFESVPFAAAAAPALDVSLVAEGPPPTKAYAFLEQGLQGKDQGPRAGVERDA